MLGACSFEVLLLFFSNLHAYIVLAFRLTRKKRNWATPSPPFCREGTLCPRPYTAQLSSTRVGRGSLFPFLRLFFHVVASLSECPPDPPPPQSQTPPLLQKTSLSISSDLSFPPAAFPSSGLPSLLSDKDAEKLLTACQEIRGSRKWKERDVRPGPQEDCDTKDDDARIYRAQGKIPRKDQVMGRGGVGFSSVDRGGLTCDGGSPAEAEEATGTGHSGHRQAEEAPGSIAQ